MAKKQVLTKGDLAQIVMETGGVSRAKAYAIVKALFDAMADALKEGKQIRITGFGSFNFGHRPERVGRNPKTGEKIKIPARKTVKFRASSAIREALVEGKKTKRKKK